MTRTDLVLKQIGQLHVQDMLSISYSIALVSSALLFGFVCWLIVKPSQSIQLAQAGGKGKLCSLVCTLSGLLPASVVIVGFLDIGSLGLEPWIGQPVGAALLVVGGVLACWGVAALGVKLTLGLSSALVTRGPYRFTRNPQYLGAVFVIVGFVLFANSSLALWPSIMAVLSAIVAPFAEEPWLQARFGEAYETYKSRTPRFL